MSVAEPVAPDAAVHNIDHLELELSSAGEPSRPGDRMVWNARLVERRPSGDVLVASCVAAVDTCADVFSDDPYDIPDPTLTEVHQHLNIFDVWAIDPTFAGIAAEMVRRVIAAVGSTAQSVTVRSDKDTPPQEWLSIGLFDEGEDETDGHSLYAGAPTDALFCDPLLFIDSEIDLTVSDVATAVPVMGAYLAQRADGEPFESVARTATVLAPPFALFEAARLVLRRCTAEWLADHLRDTGLAAAHDITLTRPTIQRDGVTQLVRAQFAAVAATRDPMWVAELATQMAADLSDDALDEWVMTAGFFPREAPELAAMFGVLMISCFLTELAFLTTTTDPAPECGLSEIDGPLKLILAATELAERACLRPID